MDDTTKEATSGSEGATKTQEAGATHTPSATEKALDKQLKAMTKERDKLRDDVGTLTQERNEAQGEVTRLKAQPGGKAAEGQDSQEQAADADPHAETKELLKRFNLPVAYVLPDGSICYDEAHAKHVAGKQFDSLTKISAE